MHRLIRVWWRVTALLGSNDLNRDMEEEFRLHMRMRAEDLMNAGMSAAEAARQARLEFGSMDRFQEEARAIRGVAWLDELRSDFRYAMRSLRKAPGFTAVAALTLALGIGANAAVFSMVNATLLRPLPYPQPEQLVAVYQTRPSDPGVPTRWSYPEFDAVRASVSSIVDIAAYYADDVNVSTGAVEPMRLRAEFVSSSYFSLLGIRTTSGRAFVSDDGRELSPTAVISQQMASAQFGGGEAAVGESLRINGVDATIIGVTPDGFRGLSGGADIWLTHMVAPQIYMADYLTSAQRFLGIAARVRAGVTMEEARAELATAGTRAAAGAAAAAGGNQGAEVLRATLRPLADAGRDVGRVRAQFALAGAALFVLLIAMLNVAGLLLARSIARAKDSAVRAALGAGRFRLLRHALVEGSLLGGLGGALGLVVGVWSVHALGTQAPASVGPRPFIGDLGAGSAVAVDWRVLAFTMIIGVAAGMLAAAAAALRVLPRDLTNGLKSAQRGSSIPVGSLRRPTILTAAALGQITSSLLLLVGAALLIDGFRQLRNADPGFNPDGVIAFTISPPETQYDNAAAAGLIERILERVEALPGVEGATVSLCTPLSPCSRTQLHIAGVHMDEAPPVGRHYVGPDHFETLGIPLMSGRHLTRHDRAGAPRVAVINETAARRFWPGEDPVGRRVWFGGGGGFASPDSLTEIVGVVRDVLYGAPGEEVRPDFYTSYLQFTWPQTTVMVRTAAAPATLVPSLRRAVADVDANLPIFNVRTLTEWTDQVIAEQRFATQALSAIAGLGLFLACLGLYGIMAWSVAQRRREIGIRLALGATGSQVMRLVIAQGSSIVVCGIALGVVASAFLANTLRAMIPHAASVSPLAVSAVAALLLLVAAGACWLPAREASRVDPAKTIGGAV